MITPRDIKWKRCRRKVAHKSEGAALAHIRSLEKREIKDGEVMAYRCRYCSQWHVGHPDKPHLRGNQHAHKESL